MGPGELQLVSTSHLVSVNGQWLVSEGLSSTFVKPEKRTLRVAGASFPGKRSAESSRSGRALFRLEANNHMPGFSCL